METITLFEEYRLIERSESEVNGAWKGAHLLLFFLAFVFGSFCTFCFHMLMYLFDEKCVLFPKLLSLTSLRKNIIYEFIPEDKEIADMLPVDFLSTQWVDKSACYLPTYVPLLSGIFGLVWTTMFLMCSTGSRTLTGHRSPPQSGKVWSIIHLATSIWILLKIRVNGQLLSNVIKPPKEPATRCYEFYQSNKQDRRVNVSFEAWQQLGTPPHQSKRLKPAAEVHSGQQNQGRNIDNYLRPWRVLLPVFVFSLAMGGLCLYATIITHNGLQELCVKLGEITGSSTCTYTVNVATLAYERRIRGVYQATRITILSAWLHTLCWLLSALLTIARVLLAVDFQLVKVSVQLKGNVDKMLERHEKQIRTVSPDSWVTEISPRSSRSHSSVKVHFHKKELESRLIDTSSFEADYIQSYKNDEGEILFKSSIPTACSEPSLVASERNKLDRIQAYSIVPQDKKFIVKIIYDLIDTLDLPKSSTISFLSPSMDTATSETKPLIRHYGRQNLSSKSDDELDESVMDRHEAEELVLEIKHNLEKRMNERFNEYQGASTSKKALEFESVMNITSEMKQTLDENVLGQSIERITLKRELSSSNVQEVLENDNSKLKKSNLKHKNIQTDLSVKKKPSPKVQITESRTSIFTDVVYESSTKVATEKNKTD